MDITLGPEVGKGGQSVVYEVVGHRDLVFKAFHDPPPADIETKVAAMIRHNQSAGIPGVSHGSHVAIAWPLRMRRLPDGRIGYTMCRARGTQKLFLIYNPAVVARMGWKVDASFRRRVAYNIAVMVHAIHDGGYVIGDLNESNILVTARGLVVIIDTDSFQAELEGTLYRCPVAKLEYLAPELAGTDLGSVKRERPHDNFALGVLMFQLLMDGWHPFTGVWPTAGDPPPIAEWIKSGWFSYGGSAKVAGRRIMPPPGAPRFDRLSDEERDYFMRCFVAGHTAPLQRPSAQEWMTLLAPRGARGAAATGKAADARKTGQATQVCTVCGRPVVGRRLGALTCSNACTKEWRRVRARMARRWRSRVFGVVLLAIITVGVHIALPGTASRLSSKAERAVREAENGAGERSAAERPVVDRSPPRIRSIVRQNPSTIRTNANSLTWRITFTEAVTVDTSDFGIIGARSGSLTVAKVGADGDVYDITLHSDDLAGHNGMVTLVVGPGATIADLAGNRLSSAHPTGRYERGFVIDNDAPRVTIGPEGGRIDDADATR